MTSLVIMMRLDDYIGILVRFIKKLLGTKAT